VIRHVGEPALKARLEAALPAEVAPDTSPEIRGDEASAAEQKP